MSVEVLSNQTANVISTIMDQPHWKKDAIQSGLKEILVQIRQSVNTHEEYLESLLRNVTILYESTNAVKSFLKHSVDEEMFFSEESFHSFMLEVRSQVTDQSFLTENMPRFEEFVYKGETIQEKEVNAELIFSNCKLINDMYIDFIGIFIHPNNREFMEPFMEYASDVMIETVYQYCTNYSGLLLEDFFKVLVDEN